VPFLAIVGKREAAASKVALRERDGAQRVLTLDAAAAELAVQAGITGDAVARALGHESFAVTTDHYARPEAVSGARTDLVLENLRNFRKSSAPDWDAA
jgi:hypothetical protein